MNASIGVTVVVPVGPDWAWLGAQLHALAEQRLPENRSELVLSCNGSSIAAVHELARSIFVDGRWELRVIDSSERRGPSHARNAGWRAAQGEQVLFCDADDVVERGWIWGLSAGLRHADVVGGRFEYEQLNPDGVGTWGAIGTDGLPEKFRHLPFVPSGNLGVRRSALETLNGFDTELDRSEDVDFSWRAAYAGLRVAYAADALLHVRRRESASGLFVQAREDACFDVPLIERHWPHGAEWSVRDLAREAAGTLVALVQAPFGAGHRAKLATRSGRCLGHIAAAPRMLRRSVIAGSTR
ncbi:glycosyltransferase [Leucobacter japonicus]|uniref:glycosyltransferase n=1 Tax=Leucobacter japonicus TaxID=1461259 RepID=UPI0006A7B924|nr:glycosyltransferase [Leucobacter japonicus]